MTRHRRKPGETVAQERARLRRQNAGRKPATAGTRRRSLPSQASATARKRAFGQQGRAKRFMGARASGQPVKRTTTRRRRSTRRR